MFWLKFLTHLCKEFTYSCDFSSSPSPPALMDVDSSQSSTGSHGMDMTVDEKPPLQMMKTGSGGQDIPVDDSLQHNLDTLSGQWEDWPVDGTPQQNSDDRSGQWQDWTNMSDRGSGSDGRSGQRLDHHAGRDGRLRLPRLGGPPP